MKVILRVLSFVVFSLVASGCSTAQPRTGLDWVGYTQTGKASFYADKHQNKKTASGELYKHNLKTAAHKNLPFGTNVQVTNISNNKSVVVTINDRGPYIRGRIIDLSRSAFSSIGSTYSGLVNVKIEVVR